MVVGRLLSYWEGNFSGAMLNFVRVSGTIFPRICQKGFYFPNGAGSESNESFPTTGLTEDKLSKINVFFWRVVQEQGSTPDGSMGLVYLPTISIKNQLNVDKYNIHGW